MHDASHPLSGQTVDLIDGAPADKLAIEDWQDRVFGQSWMYATGNPAALNYAMRSAGLGLPIDDNVVYGKDPNGLGHIVHVSEFQD